MILNTRAFGEIEIEDSKLIIFEQGIVGFPELCRFVLLHDESDGEIGIIHWLQSVQEPGFAMPIIDPLYVKEDYNPEVEDAFLNCLGTIRNDNLLVLVTLSVSADITKMSVNLQAPIVINADTRKACQIIVDNDYPVKYPIYDVLQAKKAGE